jgi:hypothetical protein
VTPPSTDAMFTKPEIPSTVTPSSNNAVVVKAENESFSVGMPQTGSWYVVPSETLLAYQLPNNQRNGPTGIVDQTIWHFAEVGNGFLFGYVWRSSNNEFPQAVARILATLTHNGDIELYFYMSSKIVNFGKVKYNSSKDFFYDMQTTSGNIIHWSLMVRQLELDEILPGTTFTINDIVNKFPLSSLPPAAPEVGVAPHCAAALQPAHAAPLVCAQTGSVSMLSSDSWYVVPNATLLAYQLPDDQRNGPIGVVDQTIWHFTKVENGFLFGYVWRSLNNEFPQNVSRILATMTHTGDVEFYFYMSSKIVNFAKGKYDSLNDTFYDMQTSGGGSNVVHWSWMVRETDLDRTLPGTTFSIDDILASQARGCKFCGSSLPPTTPSF